MVKLEKRTDGSYYAPEDPGEPHYNAPRVSVTDQEGELLTDYAAFRLVLEIGTGLGVSTRYMAVFAKHIYTIDPDPWVKENVQPELEELGNVSFTLPPEPVDLVFIDGLHIKAQLAADVQTARRHLKPGGMIVFHDANQLDLRPFGEVRYIHTIHGLAELRTE